MRPVRFTSPALYRCDYAFVETKAPSGYLLDTKRQPFSVAARQSGATTVNVTNEQKKAVRLVKTDVTTGNRLAGATFTLQTTIGEVVKSGLVTDALGEIYVNNFASGRLRLHRDTAAPTGLIWTRHHAVLHQDRERTKS